MKVSDFEKRLGSLKQKFNGWKSHYQELAELIQPRAGRFNAKKDRGEKKQGRIYDNTATIALRTLAAGMHAGMSSPSRQWFRLTVDNQGIADISEVKAWLFEVQKRMQYVFANSNFYKSLHSSYEELGLFGTSATLILEDEKDVIRCHTMTAGEYMIAVNGRGEVDTLYREFEMTVAEMVSRFGYDNCSRQVKRLYDKREMDEVFTVVHAIEPRKDYSPEKKDNQNMPFASVYFEQGSKGFLRESGFEENPILAPRWQVVSGDAYGRSPGMEVLGDVKQLQHEQLFKGKAISKQVDPPLQAPIETKTTGVNSVPNGVTFVANTSNGGIRSAYEVNLNLSYLLQDIQDVRMRINSTFYKDLFLMLAGSDRRQITAREVEERHSEKMLMLGPVLENVSSEQLDRAIERTYAIMERKGLIPEPPEVLQGIPLKIEYVSMLAQAQKAVGIGAINQMIGQVSMAAQMNPESLDKFDFDEAIDQSADMLGINPNLVKSKDEVMQIRHNRMMQQQMAQQQQAMVEAANTAQTLSNTDVEGESALAAIMKQSSAL